MLAALLFLASTLAADSNICSCPSTVVSRVEQLTSGEVAYTYTVTGIQVAAVVGGADELERVKALTGHINEKVAADARASAFYLKKKIGAR